MVIRNNIKSLIFIASAFVISRIIFYCAGVRFDASTLETAIQFIDPILLKTNLLQSVFYLHSQPPLFNLFLGIILKLFPNNHYIVFNILYLILGFIFSISVFLLMIRMGVAKRVAIFLTICFIINPSVILYENWLFYTYPAFVCLTLAALILHLYIETARPSFGFVFFLLLSILVLLKSVYHLVWFLVIVLMVICLRKINYKQILVLSAVPMLIIICVYAKNLYLFGSFTLSKVWMSHAMLTMTQKYITGGEKRDLYAKGKISAYTVIDSFPDHNEEKKIK